MVWFITLFMTITQHYFRTFMVPQVPEITYQNLIDNTWWRKCMLTILFIMNLPIKDPNAFALLVLMETRRSQC